MPNCCNTPCFFEGDEERYGPCEGDVNVVDEWYTEEDSYWVHTCAKHEEAYERLFL